MGNIYNEVAGVVQRDVEMAFTYFQKSAAQGDTMAMFNLAILYQSDEVTAKDEARVRQVPHLSWWRSLSSITGVPTL